jgi:2'-hydroxyisoflavone reductase
MKRVLILGGTGFVGRLLTGKLIQFDYDITLFNRGKRNPDLYKHVNRIIGDRNTSNIDKIAGIDWDVVVDFIGMLPVNIEKITQLLKGKAGRYIFVSSASVYDFDNEPSAGMIDENFKLLECSDEQRINPDYTASYGNKKAECERILLSSDWLDVIIFRPALIYGIYDWSDRFYYWLYRAKSGGEILIPDEGRCRSTNTYSVDCANIIQYAIKMPNHRNVYNATTHQPVTIKQILDLSCSIFDTHSQYVNVSGEKLINDKVQPWTDLPVWTGDFELLLDNTKLREDFNIELKSFENSISETAEYYESLGWPEPKYGLSLEREKELIEKYKSSS